MDHFELQRRLKGFDFYHGDVDGDIGPESMRAIVAFLNNGRVMAPQSWSKQRRVLAAKQLICRHNGIEVGAVDGLAGPQTQYAFQIYAERLAEGPSPLIPGRDTDPPEPEPATAPPIWPRQADIVSFFGAMGAGLTRLSLPFAMRIAWEPSKLVKSIMVHEKVHDSAQRCFERIADAYDAEARHRTGIELFGGCFNVRRMRGGNRWSMHSWGIAIDFDPERNGLHSNRSNARLAQDDCRSFWKIWEDEGWISLGRTRDYDWMHVQAARL